MAAKMGRLFWLLLPLLVAFCATRASGMLTEPQLWGRVVGTASDGTLLVERTLAAPRAAAASGTVKAAVQYGQPAVTGQVPYMAMPLYISPKGDIWWWGCGASLVRPTAVLTAGERCRDNDQQQLVACSLFNHSRHLFPVQPTPAGHCVARNHSTSNPTHVAIGTTPVQSRHCRLHGVKPLVPAASSCFSCCRCCVQAWST